MTSLLSSTLHTKVSQVERSQVNPSTADVMTTPSSDSRTDERVKARYNDIIKSANDKRFYRGLVLSNEMKVLLISDPTTDKSAASLDVNVGSMTDPEELPGLAHFCEHMLFLGTKKYPNENDYDSFLSQNNGSSSAATYADHTNYFFDVDPKKLQDALDRFVQFFLEPLFTESSTEKEVNAVNSENDMNLASDVWRIDQLEKSSSSPKHAFSKFGTGSLDTLLTIPKSKGIDVRESLLKYHNTWYSANIMSLSVFGKESLDELEKIVVDLFSNVENKNVEAPTWPDHPFDKEQHFMHKWYIVPVKDIRNLSVVFPIPDMTKHYKVMTDDYVANLLGHEGEGSLLSALRAKGWCNSLFSGNKPSARGFSFFEVSVDLTETGIEHVDDIITLMFQYIAMLNEVGPIEWIYEESRDIAKMNFQLQEKSPPESWVGVTVMALQDYPMEDVLTAYYLFNEFRPDLIDELMSYLKPENMRVQIVGKKFADIADETEHWYGTQYKKERIPLGIIDKWNEAGLCEDLKLPPRNEFIPTKFDLKLSSGATIEKYPQIIENTPYSRVWFKQDDEYLVPKANLSFDIFSPFASMDPVSVNLTYMFVSLFQDSLNEFSYAAELAGLEWSLSSTRYELQLLVSGYNDKIHVLLDKITDKMVNFTVDSKRFDILKDAYIRDLKNFEAEQPCEHASCYQTLLLSEQTWHTDELLEACTDLTAERVQRFIPQFLEKIHIECLFHGNLTKTEALGISSCVVDKLRNSFKIIPLLPSQLLLLREVKLEERHYMYESINKLHKSSCAKVYYQCGQQSTEENMQLELLSQIISEPCFDTLRTKEQLGYIVSSEIRRSSGVQGLQVTVQSDRHPKYVEGRVEQFLKSMLEHLVNMTEEEFNRHKESLASLRLEKPMTLSDLSFTFWIEISSQQYNFDKVNIEVAYLRTISKEQIIQFYNRVILEESPQLRKLSIHVVSMAEGGAGTKPIGDVETNEISYTSVEETTPELNKPIRIDDVISFKSSQPLYPLLKPFNNDIPRKGTSSKL